MEPVIARVPTHRLVGAAAVCVVAVGAVVLWQHASSSTPVSLDDALHTFRDRPAGAAPENADAPPPGVYRFQASGSEVGTVGPLRVRRPVPAEANLVVTPTPDGFETEWQISQEHIEGYRFRVHAGWATLVWRRVDVSFLGVGRDDRRDVTGSARWIPTHPRVGQTWPVDFWTAKLHTTGTGRVVRRETITVAGRPEPAYLVEVDTRTAGAHGGPRTERIWWSARDRVPLRVEATTALGGVVGFRSQVSMRLAAAAPLR